MKKSRLLLISLIFTITSLLFAIPIVYGAQNLTCATITELAEFYMNGGATWDPISDGDICFVFKAGSDREMVLYIFDVDSGQTEDSDMYVTPDYTSSGRSYTGTGRWVKMSVNVNDLLADDDIELDDKLVFEGATEDAYETTFSITDPNADRTITVPNSDETIGIATSIQDDLITKADFADEDWGDMSVSSNSVTLDDDVIDPNHMTDADHGDFSYSSGAATLDADVVGSDEIANGDYGDFTFTDGSAALDEDVIAPSEMADADHGDFTYTGGVATLDILNNNLTIKNTDPSIIFDVDPNATDTNFWIGAQADAQDDDDDKFQIGDGTTPGTNPFVTVDTSGNVGIGITSPLDKLSINGNLRLENNQTIRWKDVAGTARNVILLTSNDILQIINNSDNDGGPINFYTKTGGSISMVLDNTGSLSIGSSNPSSLLDLEQSGTAKSSLGILELTNSVNAADMDGTETSIIFNQWYYDANTPAVADEARISAGTETDWTSTASTQDSYLAFKTALNGTVGEKVRVDSLGNVGIGITSPDGELNIVENDGTSNINLDAFDDGAGTANLTLRKSDSDTIGTKSETDDGDILGYIQFHGVDTESNFDTGAFIRTIQNGDAGIKIPTDLILESSTSSATNYNQLVLSSNSNIGIKVLNDPVNTLDVEGSINQRDYFWEDEFDYEASGVEFESGLTADFWVTGGTNYASANVTFTAGPGGTMAAVTAGSDDDSVHATGVSNFRVNSNPILEARFKVADITNVYIVAGFVEGSYDDKATHDDDIFVVGIDSDDGHGYGADQIVAISNDNAGGATYMDTNTPMVNNTYIIIKIDLTDTEQPRVWIDNTEIAAARITGTVQAGISISPYFMVQSLSGAADTATIDYIKCWQDRS